MQSYISELNANYVKFISAYRKFYICRDAILFYEYKKMPLVLLLDQGRH